MHNERFPTVRQRRSEHFRAGDRRVRIGLRGNQHIRRRARDNIESGSRKKRREFVARAFQPGLRQHSQFGRARTSAGGMRTFKTS